MSQADGYQYQSYGDPNNIVKAGPLIINGQTNDQNGIQSPNSNLTGTPSSQSSRDPSRETSRDPSPTHYLHNQYRPQLQRPPMPPINGQNNLNPNLVSPLPRVTQYNTVTPPQNTQQQPQQQQQPPQRLPNLPPPAMFPSPTYPTSMPSIPQTNAQIPTIPSGNTGIGNVVTSSNTLNNSSKMNFPAPPAAPPNKNYSWSPNPQPPNLSPNSNSNQNSQPPQSQFRTINPNPPPLPDGKQFDQNSNQGLQNPSSTTNDQKYTHSQQNLFTNAQNTPKFSPNMNTSTQNLFTNSLENQNPSASSNLPSPPQNHYPLPPKTQIPPPPMQAQYSNQMQYNHQKDLGPNPQPQQQQNLGSQRKYPPLNPYTANMPPPPTMSRPNVSPTAGAQQYQPQKPQEMPPPPPLSGQRMPYQPDATPVQSQYPGQMSNIPLEPMSKRYPGAYPDQLNQLNNQMSGMSVTQAGFNKLWGTESIDLLQCRNVLPSEKVEPPKIRLQQEFLDSVNCSSDIFRCTLTKVPETNSLLQKSRLPLGVLIHPFKDLNHLPVIQCSTIVRCRSCRTYINPFIYFVDSKRWKCNICYRVNDLPEEFQFDPVTKSYGDPSRRPEVKTSTIEFIAPSEYMLRPPQPAVYLFILDVSRLAVESGYLNIVCNVISEELSRLPGDGRTQIGFLAVDSTIHFFSMPDNVSQPHEMIMLDVDDVFLPCPDNLIVNLKEREELVRDLLAQLPKKFQGTHDTNSALGAGLQAAYKLVSPTGGRITVFQTCLPNLGPGLLQPREDPNSRASKDVPHLNPATDFYKRLALDCSGQQVAIDLFLLNSQYSDLATLSGMCKFSGGCIYHLPLFRATKPQYADSLERMLRRYLTRKIGFEAVMRIRCTRGLSIHTFHGNFFVRSTDLLSLPNVNPDAGFGMQISIDENLSDVQNVCFQAALLYTSSKGERRIRVHTLCLPVATTITDILFSADQQCIIGLLSKMAVDRSQQSSLSDARDAFINVAIDVLSAYKLAYTAGSGGLLAPVNLKLLPLYIIALLKCVAFRSGTSTRLDDRVFAMCQLKTLPLCQLIQMIYPDLYPVHNLDERNAKEIDGKICCQSPRLHLSAEKLDSRGAFLMDAGDKIFIYIGKNIHPQFCVNVLDVSSFAAIPEECYELPELDTPDSERLRNFLFSLQEEKPYYASVQIIRDDSHFRTLFTERLIEDRFESALSYYEFLQHLKTQVK